MTTMRLLGVSAALCLALGASGAAAGGMQHGEKQEKKDTITSGEKKGIGPQEHGAAMQPAAGLGELQAVRAEGTIEKTERNKLTLRDHTTGKHLEVIVSDKTAFLSDGRAMSRDDLKEGQTVRAALIPVGDDLFALAMDVDRTIAAAPKRMEAGELEKAREKARDEARRREQEPAQQQPGMKAPGGAALPGDEPADTGGIRVDESEPSGGRELNPEL